MPHTVRNATFQDMEQIVAIAKRQNKFSAHAMMLISQRLWHRQVYVVEVGNRICGFLSYHFDHQGNLHVDLLESDAGFSELAIVRHLLNYLQQWVRNDAQEIPAIVIDTPLTPAIHWLSRRLGFSLGDDLDRLIYPRNQRPIAELVFT